MTLRQIRYVSPQQCRTNLYLHRLKVKVLLSSGSRATVESMSSLHSSSTMVKLPHWMPIARAVSAKFKAFSFPVIKGYSVIPYSAFYSVPYTRHAGYIE